jgi:CheY-like chemotaxis protein
MKTLLVVSSDNVFAELIRQHLEEVGSFRVRIAGNVRSAIDSVKEFECPLVFLDTCLAERDLLEIGSQLRQAHLGIRFVVISEAGWHSALEELSPDNYLSKPYRLSDLQEMMDNLFSSPHTPAPSTSEPDNNPPWLSDVSRAAQHLTRLTLESSAQAALITSDDQLWAYAGQLPQTSTGELTETVLRYWDRQKESDLVRFVHLTSTGAEHMLYATRLTKNMVLALIFDAETPFSTIHTQANQLVHSLSASPAEKQNDPQDEEEDIPSAHISAILTDIPSPNPNQETKTLPLKYTNKASVASPISATLPLRFSRESSPAIHLDRSVPQEEDESSIDLEKTVVSPSTTRKSKFRWNGAAQEAQEDEEVTRPNSISESARRIILDPVSPSVYNLDYACLLVPRLPNHHLIGDLSDRLPDWMRETCIAFAWRLEYLAVRPEYLLWNVNVAPSASPAYLMRIMRQQISARIFEDFPRLKKENPSGDFWASGYLIMGGSHPPAIHIIKEFIAQTRQRQGINLPLH